MPRTSTLGADRTLDVGNKSYSYAALAAAEALPGAQVARLPRSLKVLLENLLRHEDGEVVRAEDIAVLAAWPAHRHSEHEIALYPVRVLMPDSSGIPLLADLAAMRDAMMRHGGDAAGIDPRIPVDLVADHSVTVDVAGRPDAFLRNIENDYRRNRERYVFLRWAQQAYRNLRIIPPGAGILHQVNLEWLSRPIWSAVQDGSTWAFPDSLVGMDSHTPMINALGVIGWGVGGIEAGSVMLGEPLTLRIPDVIGCRLTGRLRPGVTAMDLALTVTERLRKRDVAGTFVEYCGPGVAGLSLPDRATLANMAPEYGATLGFFPIDAETVRFLRETGRDPADVALAEAYARAQGLWGGDRDDDIAFTDVVEIDLGAVGPSLAGPRRPQDRRSLGQVPGSFREAFPAAEAVAPGPEADRPLRSGDIVLAAITSCTNTSNPDGMLGAGLLARNAVARGLSARPWVKTSLSPGSRTVMAYLDRAGLTAPLEALGFHLTGYGCMTCAGGSGPLIPEVAAAVDRNDLVVAAVLSANRNFESRIHPQVRAAYLGTPALVVAAAIAGTVLRDWETEPLGDDPAGRPVHLRDIWPDPEELRAVAGAVVTAEVFRTSYAKVLEGDAFWKGIPGLDGARYPWDPESTYLVRPPFFEKLHDPGTDAAVMGARALLMLGDSITTDHINPMGSIPKRGLAARWLKARGVAKADYHSYLDRRANHNVMLRGIFANPRLRNELVAGVEGGFTRHQPSGDLMTVFDAATRYAETGVPVVVVAGREYGTGSSRDWAAKGTRLLGIRAVIAEGFERIHRSNLVGMGVIPLQLPAGVTRATLALDGTEVFDLPGTGPELRPGATIACVVRRADGSSETVPLRCRIDTSRELAWYRAGGVLHYVLRETLRREGAAA